MTPPDFGLRIYPLVLGPDNDPDTGDVNLPLFWRRHAAQCVWLLGPVPEAIRTWDSIAELMEVSRRQAIKLADDGAFSVVRATGFVWTTLREAWIGSLSRCLAQNEHHDACNPSRVSVDCNALQGTK